MEMTKAAGNNNNELVGLVPSKPPLNTLEYVAENFTSS